MTHILGNHIGLPNKLQDRTVRPEKPQPQKCALVGNFYAVMTFSDNPGEFPAAMWGNYIGEVENLSIADEVRCITKTSDVGSGHTWEDA